MREIKKFEYYARWIAFLPASILAAFLALAATRLWLLFIMSDGMFGGVVTEAFPSVACGVAFIEAAYYIAPSHKKPATFSLLAALLLFIGFGFATSLIFGNLTWQIIVALVATLLGAGISTWLRIARIESTKLAKWV